MSSEKLKIIQKLMDELITDMEPTKEHYMEKLGKKKPEIEVVKMEGEIPIDMEDEDEDEMMEDDEMSDEPMSFSSILGGKEMEDDREESDLKKKYMKLKGM